MFRILYKYIAIFLFIFPLIVNAQVTIGSGIPPVEGALLDLKEHAPNVAGVTATKGLGLPRVNLASPTALDPIVGDVNELVGLLVYNTNSIATDRFCPGPYVWTGTEWNHLLSSTMGMVVDVEGNTYRIATFGSAGTWMIENLRTKTYANGTSLPLLQNGTSINTNSQYYIFPNVSPTVDKDAYGLLYTWAAATNNAHSDYFDNPGAGTVKSTVQGICPAGWVVPSDYDWTLLETEIANNSTTYSTYTAEAWDPSWEITYNTDARGDFGISMKSPVSVNGVATDGQSSPVCKNNGFNVLMVGGVNDSNTDQVYTPDDYGNRAYFWTSSQQTNTGIFKWYRRLYASQSSGGVERHMHVANQYIYSVRCKKAD
ncbi:MAG: FISUMP domain-containing protein [Dysgonomonas sp.]